MFNINSAKIREIQEALNINFPSALAAFQYFCSFKTGINNNYSNNSQISIAISFNQFLIALNSLMRNRFRQEEIAQIWLLIVKNNSENYLMNKQTFLKQFDNQQYKGDSLSLLNTENQQKSTSNTKLQQSQISSGSGLRASSINFNSGNNFLQQLTYTDAFQKLKLANKTSTVPLLQLCKETDTKETGFLTNLEFRKILKRLPGIKTQDINLIMRGALANAGMLKYEDVCKQLVPNQMDEIIEDRTKVRLKKMKDDIYYYMLSPKDAFRQFDYLREGRLTLDQFNEFIVKLHQLNGQQCPPFNVIKDLFDFIDIRHDGVIDIHEWMQTFRSLQEGKIEEIWDKKGYSPIKKLSTPLAQRNYMNR
eukprot:TRINITY_DN7556_c0_g1_i1.p1 TRINITY_DN7556_c0_g1~~TRINITY_DN7556_c0_g1_i1.p1  ORF type:complete len:364 (-),score=67.45 TRINITY_DN7556_c0_g1_i1:210-1301(-)